jgi:hypothetical protein
LLTCEEGRSKKIIIILAGTSITRVARGQIDKMDHLSGKLYERRILKRGLRDAALESSEARSAGEARHHKGEEDISIFMI